MVRSMTGFGRAAKTSETGGFVMEIKSVNHRFLDSRIYLPRDLSSLEIPLSKILKKRLARGKVDVSVQWTPAADYLPRLEFDRELLKHYQTEIVNLAQPLRCEDQVPFEYLLSLPGVSEKKTPDLDLGPVLDLASETLGEALDALVAERGREGEALRQDLAERLDNLETNRAAIEERREEVVEAFRARLKKKAKEWAASVSVQMDEGRLETEILLFAERSDVTEELTRLAVHIVAFRKDLEAEDGEPKGKPLEFLTQELLRETNTIASKARDTDILSRVLEMKNEIEKIREQIMNVE